MPARPAETFSRVLESQPSHWLWRALDVLIDWQERATQRHALAALDERMLRDIGLSRADIHAEISKPFWQP